MTGGGLYLPDGTFLDFSEIPERQALLSEIATRSAVQGFDVLGWLGMLPDPDPVLRKRMEGVDVLEELTADDQVTMAMQSRKLKTLNKRDYEFLPGAKRGHDPTPDAARLCDALVEDLEAIDIYNLISEVLDAPYYGMTVVELLWRQDGARLRLADAVAKPRQWFGFNSSNELTFRSLGNIEGKPVPFGKFVLARHFSTYQNPYGLRLLSRVLWPVAFKKGGVKFWMNFAERFGTPWVIGTTTGQQQDQDRMLAALTGMIQSAVAVVRGGAEVKVVESSGKSGDVHRQMYDTWNAAISKVLMGQTLTAEVGDTGSYAAAKEHGQVLTDYAAADEHLVTTFFNDLAWAYGQINAGPGVFTPVFRYVEPADYASAAELDTKLKGLGVQFKKSHFVDRYGLSEDEFDVPGPEVPEPVGEFAEGSGNTAQQAIERLVADVLPEGERISAAMIRELLDLVGRAESFDDAQVLLAEYLGVPAGDPMEDLLHRALVAANLWGMRTGSDNA